jgi:replicative DNA helicase
MSPVTKVPPHDLTAESSVLGAILIDPEAMLTVSELLRPESFYEPAHQTIFEAMVELYEERQPIDAVTVTNNLKKSRKLQGVGGAAAIAELTNTVSTAAHVGQYAKLVAEAALRRVMISAAGQLSELAFDETKQAQDIMDLTEQTIFGLSQQSNRQGFIPIKETLAESFERLDELQKSGEDLRGLPTGFNDLDTLLAGLQKSNLIILAARPGMGKTAFALSMARHNAITAHKKVGFFSLEMSKEELVDRLLVAQSDIDAWKLKTGRLDQQDFMKLSEGMGVLAEAQIFIDDSPGLSIFEMRTKARRLMMEHQIDLLVVDYLQLAHGRTKDNRVQEVAEISQGLKNIARELRIPVIALSQLSRAIESRGEKVPQLSDLRESGSIEQDADVVMFLYRKDDDIRESVSIKVAKHRNGPVGDVDLFFRGERMKFYGLETRQQMSGG